MQMLRKSTASSPSSFASVSSLTGTLMPGVDTPLDVAASSPHCLTSTSTCRGSAMNSTRSPPASALPW
eukprot:9444919-Lingulodinium_polyedra.AAC.1